MVWGAIVRHRGYVERLWRSVEYEEVYLKDDADGWEAEQSRARNSGYYCERRRQQSLGCRTPAEVYSKAGEHRECRR
jgi:putative transposase